MNLGTLPAHETRPARSVVCGIDGSESAQAAARFAVVLARRMGLDLLAVHVATHSERSRGPAEFLAEAGARGLINQALSAARAHGAEARLEHGPPAMRLALVAAEEAAAALVLGARGEFGPDSTSLGSVAASAVALSPCPLVLMPPAATPRAGGLGDGELLVARAEDQQTLAVAAALARALDADLRIAGPRTAAARRAALIIIGPHGPGPRRSDAIDPLTRSILRDATVPVMVLPAHVAALTQHAMATGEA